MLLGGVAWIGSHELDPAKPLASDDASRSRSQVVSLDWKWLFIYPEQGVASVNQLVVPAGVPLHFSLTSASVMNAFFVPQLGSMIYTMNGMTTQLNLQADEPGTYPRPVGALQRRRLLRHALRGRAPCRRRVRRLGRDDARQPARRSTPPATRRSRGRARTCRRSTYRRGRARACSTRSSTQQLAARPRARDRRGGTADAAAGRSTDMLGKLSWAAIPVRPADPAGRRRRSSALVILGVLAWVIVKG